MNTIAKKKVNLITHRIQTLRARLGETSDWGALLEALRSGFISGTIQALFPNVNNTKYFHIKKLRQFNLIQHSMNLI